MQCSQIQEEKVTYIPQQLNCMRKTCHRGVHGKTLNTDLQSRPPSISFAGTSTRIMKELEEDGEGQKGEIRAGMLCVSGSTIPSKMGIHNYNIDYSGVTPILLPFFLSFFFFHFLNQRTRKPSSSRICFLQNKNHY